MKIRKFILRHLGVYYMVLASVFFAFTGVFAKLMSSEIPSVEIVFFRNLIGMILIILAIKKRPLKQNGGKFGLLIFRGIAGTISILAFFYNIANMGLAEAFTFSKTAPIFVALIAAVFFKERLSLFSWAGVFVGFIGIVLMMQPELGLKKTDIMAIANGFFATLAYTSIHELRKAYDTRIIVFSFVFLGTLTPLVLMILSEFFTLASYFDFAFAKFVIPDAKLWVFILFMGVCGVYYQIYLTKAFAASKKVGAISAVGYCDVIFTMILGLFLGDALPNVIGFFGIILIVMSGLTVAREK